MKALVLHDIGDLRLDTVPEPTVGPDDVLIRVAACGVCGSDLPRIFMKGTYRFPLICGHEFAGIVESWGDHVHDVERGERVVVFPLIWCGVCSACEQGRYGQCAHYDYVGSRRDGAFAEYIAVPRKNIVRIPPEVSVEEAALAEPAAVALHALTRAGGIGAGSVVVVFGAGPIGLLVAQWARSSGASKIILFDVEPRKLELAQTLGFTLCFDAREKAPQLVVNDLSDGAGAEIAIDATGVPVAMVNCLECIGRQGTILALGNPSTDILLPAPLVSRFMRMEASVLGTWNSSFSAYGNRDDWRTTLQAFAEKKIVGDRLISHRVALEEAKELLAGMFKKSISYSKVIITP